ncbi:MAG TPA: alpha-amylase family glycosyl hydrolase [Polyangiaceae bacterium]
MKTSESAWWKRTTVYQIYVRSFADSNGDGIGDLRGVIGKLDYLHELGVETRWLSPFFESPQADFGYDVSDHYAIAPEYGSLDDCRELIRAVHDRGMKNRLRHGPEPYVGRTSMVSRVEKRPRGPEARLVHLASRSGWRAAQQLAFDARREWLAVRREDGRILFCQFSSLPAGSQLPERKSQASRDRCRTPMQWDGERNAGFTTEGATPWLPVHPGNPSTNVSAQSGDPESLLCCYRSLLQLRREVPALRTGGLLWIEAPGLSGDVVACRRSGADAAGSVADAYLNFSNRETSVNLDGPPGRMLFSNRRGERALAPAVHRLRPYEAIVVFGPSDTPAAR